jgi:hypothetical protein
MNLDEYLKKDMSEFLETYEGISTSDSKTQAADETEILLETSSNNQQENYLEDESNTTEDSTGLAIDLFPDVDDGFNTEPSVCLVNFCKIFFIIR